MYTLVYHYRETIGSEVFEWNFKGTEFKLRNHALHYLDKVQDDYYGNGYETGQIVDGINCYKSEKTDNGDRKFIEVIIKVEKA